MPLGRRRTRTPPRSAPVDGPAPQSTLRAAALGLLGRRDYTLAELRDKLLTRGYPEDDVNTTLQELSAVGLVDDRRVAAAFVRTASSIKGRGRLRIRHELEARGVDRAVVQELVAAMPADDEAAAIERVLTRKRWPARPSAAERQRMFQHLLRRGFPADAISKALRKRGGQNDE